MDSRTSMEWMDVRECWKWPKKANPIMSSMRLHLTIQMQSQLNFKICTISLLLQVWSVTIVHINAMNLLEEPYSTICLIAQKLVGTWFLRQMLKVKKNAMKLLLCFSKNKHGNMSKSISIIDSTKLARNQVNRSMRKYMSSKNLIHKKKWRKNGLYKKKRIPKENNTLMNPFGTLTYRMRFQKLPKRKIRKEKKVTGKLKDIERTIIHTHFGHIWKSIYFK